MNALIYTPPFGSPAISSNARVVYQALMRARSNWFYECRIYSNRTEKAAILRAVFNEIQDLFLTMDGWHV